MSQQLGTVLDHLKDSLGGFEPSHHRHRHVHKYQLIGSVGAPARIFKSLFEHIYRNVAICGFVDAHVEVFLNHKPYRHHIEGDIINH